MNAKAADHGRKLYWVLRASGICLVGPHEYPRYDIFSGQFDKDAMWLEAVKGLGAACNKMKERARKSPGPYFVFCQNANKVLAHIKTRISEDIQVRESA
jgi:hypothetical protein